MARHQRIRHDTHRILIGGGGQFFRHPLLRGHIFRRADHHPRAGKPNRIQQLGDPEVHQKRAAMMIKHDVAGLDVAVDDTLIMCIIQRAAQLLKQVADLTERGAGREVLLAAEITVTEGSARQHPHDDET